MTRFAFGHGRYGESEPSPYCGRLDDHDPHEWSTPYGGPYDCPGPPLITEAERPKTC